MKRLMTIMALLLTLTMQGLSQGFNYNKITPDLLEEINGSTKSGEMFQTIIFLNEQFDAQKLTRQMQHFSKVQQREYVMNELQQVSRIGQSAILKDLHQGQKAELVEDIQSFWIINAISCSMTKDMVYAIAERPDVKFVMKDYEIHVADCEVSKNDQYDRSNDPWNVIQVHAPEVWNLGYTGQDIIVAVIDTGVNYNHTDIVNNMWDGGDEYPNHGWDFANNDNDPMDDVDHGTHCAGTVSSYGTNGKQCGIAKDTKIMALKSLVPNGSGGGTGSTSDGWAAVEFAVSHGADILSMSLGSAGKGGNWAYRAVMENVLHCGIIASVSAGNEGNNLSEYPVPNNVGSPGNCPSPWRHPDQTLNGGRAAVVAVGATTSDDTHSSFSSYGPSTWAYGESIGYYNDYRWTQGNADSIGLIKPDISAPGSGILSLSHSSNTGYCSMDGTSMAAPCVAGVMALMLSANPTLTPVEIDSIIETTAIPCGGQTSKNNTFGAGRIDALAAINYMLDACAVPTNLVATINGADVVLNWDAAENVTSYRIYRNGAMIAQTVSNTTFTDMNAPAGTNTYFVRSNGENYKASLPSNQCTVNITTNVEILAPCNLVIENTNENSATLSWESPSPIEKVLCHTESGTTYLGNNYKSFITAQRFPASMLQQYNGMQIEHIYFSVLNTDVECSIELYEGDAMQPNHLIHSGTFITSEEQQSVDYLVNPAVQVNSDKDLWLSITMSDRLLVNNDYESNGNGDAFMFKVSASDKYWMSNLGLSWSFKIGFSNGEYFYNVYSNGQIVSSNQSSTTYTASLVDGMNDYHVNSVSNNYESTKSNSIKIVKTACTQENVVLNVDDKLIVLPNSTLTVTETFSNDNPENLILENGAQLIHSGSDVYATVKKDIAAYTTEKNGWNFIASPISSQLETATIDGLIPENEETTFDLYKYNEPNHKWYNYKPKNDNAEPGFAIEPQIGYLYACSENTTLSFAGKLQSQASITINNLSYSATELKGFNLVGNPLPFNAYVSKSYYKMNNERTNIVAVTSNSETVAPCTGIIVEATGENESVTFSQTQMQWSNRGQLQITVAENKMDRDGTSVGTMKVDNAIINLNETDPLQKFVFNEDYAKLYIPQGDENYAIACANNRKEMPLNFKPNQNGTFTLTVQPESVEMSYLLLIDNMTGNHVNLLTTPSYTFEAKMDDYESRFKLLFAAANEETAEDEGFGFIINGQFQSIIGQGLLQVIDLNGRILRSADEVDCIGLNGLSAGVYVLRFIAANNVKTQKIVIE